MLKLRRFLQNSTSLATSYRLTTAVTNENNNRDRPRRVKKLKSSTCIGQFVLGCDHYLSHYRTDLISGCFFFFKVCFLKYLYLPFLSPSPTKRGESIRGKVLMESSLQAQHYQIKRTPDKHLGSKILTCYLPFGDTKKEFSILIH